MDRPITEPPPPGRTARFAPDFGQRVLLTVDTEEEFDWSGPFTRDRHGLAHVPAIARFQQFCDDRGVSPVYLVDWPVATDPAAVGIRVAAPVIDALVPGLPSGRAFTALAMPNPHLVTFVERVDDDINRPRDRGVAQDRQTPQQPAAARPPRA